MKTMPEIICPHCTRAFHLAPTVVDALRRFLIEEGGPSFQAGPKDDQLLEQYRLQLRERDGLIVSLRGAIQELQVKISQPSPQRQGDAFEIDAMEQLKAAFPGDLVTRVGKGKRGGDLVHEVRDNSGARQGSVLWELKNGATWQSKWTAKAKADAERVKADLVV